MADSQRKTANLYDYQTMSVGVSGKFLRANGTESTGSEWNISDYIPCNGNEFTINPIGGQTPAICLYDENKEYITGKAYETGGVETKLPITITSSSTAYFIRFTYRASSATYPDDLSAIMINAGSTALPYEPYGWQHSLRKYDTATDTFTTLPVDIYTDGTNATVGLKGNMSQTGTPTPSNPVEVNGVGERTENLFDGEYPNIDGTVRYRALNLGNGTYTLSSTVEISQGSAGTLFFLAGDVSSGASTATNAVYKDRPITVTSTDGYVTIAYRTYTTDTPVGKETMLNTGSTALPYEPYGYKIPISSANTTTPVYLGEVQTTRRVRKLVLTGNEAFIKNDNQSNHYLYYGNRGTILSGSIQKTPILCNELPATSGAPQTVIGINTDNTFGVVYFNFGAEVMNAQPSGNTVEGLKEYLAAQYANGTPVTVWYVLTTEETGIVNEPIRKIGDYADTVSGISIPTITGKDTVDIETSLKPSEVELTYTGWHDAEVKEKSDNLWNESYTGIKIDVITYQPLNVSDGDYTLSSTVTVEGQAAVLFLLAGNVSSGATTANNGVWNGQSRTVTAVNGYVTIGYRKYTEANPENANTMLNSGSTALPYEPYWK